MKRVQKFLCAAISVLLVSACQAPRGLQHEVSAPQIVVDKQQSKEVKEFALILAQLPMGTVQIVEKTPYGPTQVCKDRDYVNGLGEQCYRFTISGESDRHYVAVCRGKDQQWRYVELVH